jgi:hypothetical protein
MSNLILHTDPLLLILIIALINSAMDKIRFRYELTIFSRLGADWWFDPSVSWKNKYRWKPTWLFKTVLVWVTDLWHLLKFIMLNLIFVWIIVLTYNEFLWEAFFIYWLFWGIVFETNYSIKF